MDGEKSILRWGGLAGILGSLVFILVPVTLFGFVPQAPAGSARVEGGALVDPAAVVRMFPDVRAAITAGNVFAFVSEILSVALFLALYRALRGTRPASALLGSALYILGLAVLFTETVTQVAFDPISNLYNAPGATPEEQATLTLVWQATQGIFYELDTAAVLLMSVGIVVLGFAMLGSPRFGRVLGGLSMVLGAAAFAVIFFFGVTSLSAAILVVPIFIVLPILLGWKVYSLSRTA